MNPPDDERGRIERDDTPYYKQRVLGQETVDAIGRDSVESGVNRKVTERAGATSSALTRQENVADHNMNLVAATAARSVLEKEKRGEIDDTMPGNEDGAMFFEGTRFAVKESFKLFYSARGMEERVIQALALNVLDKGAIDRWEDELRTAVQQGTKGWRTNGSSVDSGIP